MTLNKLIAVIALSAGLAACGGDDDDNTPTPTPSPEPVTITDIASGSEDFELLTAALEATGLDETLDDASASFTVFAPTDAAFELLGQETLDALLAAPTDLAPILTYHVLMGEVDAAGAAAAAGQTVATVNGKAIGISLAGDDLLVNTALVVQRDIQADNGIIHVIDAVLMPPADRGEPSSNIIETAQAAGSFTTLLTALDEAELTSALEDETGTFTVFAPTDAAFALLGEDNIAALLAEPEALSAVLLQHVINNAEVTSVGAYAANGTNVEMYSGASIPVAISGGDLTVGGATVTTADIYTTNGVIHVIDAVIVGDLELPEPPMSLVEVAENDGGFTLLLEALEATGLDLVLGDLETDFTVFAPTDAAFNALGQASLDELFANPERLQEILEYHVLLGEVDATAAIAAAAARTPVATVGGPSLGISQGETGLLINTASVALPNVQADNGVIHVIDAVLLPPAAMGEPTMNIVETAIDAGIFTTLVDAVLSAGLDGVLSNEEEEFTVFAPTDAAFELLGAENIAALFGNTEILTDLLLQHVVQGATVSSVDAYVANGTDLITADGVTVPVAIEDGVLTVGGVTVTTADIYTSNGVIHVIDAVIVGDLDLPMPSLVDVASANGFDLLVAALEATDLDEVLGNLDNTYTVFAPTDAAFEAQGTETLEYLLANPGDLADILLYHVLPGSVDSTAAVAAAGGAPVATAAENQSLGLSYVDSTLYVNTASVTLPNVSATNGLIHVIDQVLLPQDDAGAPTMNIVDTAIAAGSFTTLVNLVTDAGLAGTLSDAEAEYTVFAPTDAAFDLIPEETLTAIGENATLLEDLLLQHVVAGAVDSVTAFTLNGTEAGTAGGADIPVSIVNGQLLVGGSVVSTYDIHTSNGIIHVIDAVIVGDLTLP